MKLNRQKTNLSNSKIQEITIKVNDYIDKNYNQLFITDGTFEKGSDVLIPITINNKTYDLKLIYITGSNYCLNTNNIFQPTTGEDSSIIFELKIEENEILHFKCNYHSNSYDEEYGKIYTELIPVETSPKVINVWVPI